MLHRITRETEWHQRKPPTAFTDVNDEAFTAWFEGRFIEKSPAGECEEESVIIVPAGELVDVVDIKAVPEDQGRRDISQGIAKYKVQGREFVPIAIRDWFALVEVTSLELVTTGPAETLSPKARRKRTGVPGLPAAELAPCATD